MNLSAGSRCVVLTNYIRMGSIEGWQASNRLASSGRIGDLSFASEGEVNKLGVEYLQEADTNAVTVVDMTVHDRYMTVIRPLHDRYTGTLCAKTLCA